MNGCAVSLEILRAGVVSCARRAARKGREDVTIAYGKDEIHDFSDFLVRTQRDNRKTLVLDVVRDVNLSDRARRGTKTFARLRSPWSPSRRSNAVTTEEEPDEVSPLAITCDALTRGTVKRAFSRVRGSLTTLPRVRGLPLARPR